MGSVLLRNGHIKIHIVKNDFLAWLLIGWQQCCQPIRSQVGIWILTWDCLRELGPRLIIRNIRVLFLCLSNMIGLNVLGPGCSSIVIILNVLGQECLSIVIILNVLGQGCLSIVIILNFWGQGCLSIVIILNVLGQGCLSIVIILNVLGQGCLSIMIILSVLGQRYWYLMLLYLIFWTRTINTYVLHIKIIQYPLR